MDVESCVQSVAQPLITVFVVRRWSRAALSRWGGTISVLKKVVLGCVMGNIIPNAIVSLRSASNITETKIAAMSKDMEDEMKQSDGDDNKWALQCCRMLRCPIF